MSLWRQLAHGLRALTNRKATDQEVADETQQYLDEATAALVTAGLAPDEAKRVARLELGNLTGIREQVRSYGWENVVEALVTDIRLAARRLHSAPAFTLVSTLTLALGIGASTAIFSAVKPILFEPLPYLHSNRLVMIWDIFKGERSEVTFHTYREVVARSHSLEGVAAADKIPWQPTVTGTPAPERLNGQSVSASYFHVLGVSAALGSDFKAADDLFHGPRVVILSDGLWKRDFGADPTIIGREIRLDDDLWTVVAVMPAGFDNVLSPTTDIWKPLQYDAAHISQLDTGEWGHHLEMLGRLRSGTSLDQTRRELEQIAQNPIAEFPRAPWASLSSGLIVDSLQDQVTRAVKPALFAVCGAVILVLLIVCVNVANLLLARGAQRRGEFATCAALGASRMRILTQLLSESLLLAAVGGVLSIFVAKVAIWIFVTLSPTGLPRVNAISLDTGVFVYAFALTALVGLLTGLTPALDAGRTELVSQLQESSRRIAGSYQIMRRALVVGEVALALVLLVSAGLLLRSLERLFAVEPGFDPAHLLTMEIQISGHRYDKDSARQQFVARALEAVRRVPGVVSAASSNVLPFSGIQADAYTYGAEFEDHRSYDVCRYVVSPGYFETMAIPLHRGHLLNDHDIGGSAQVALISESLANRQFGADPIGKRVRIGPLNKLFYTIAGVVGNVKQASLAEQQLDAVYITPTQSWFADDSVAVIARGHGNAKGLASPIQSAIWSVDRDQAIVHVATMGNLIAKSAAERRFAMIVFEGFAFAALMLAAIGLYGVLAGSVAERTREIGVRTALGASRGDILGLVVRQGLKLAGLGTLIGFVVAAGATQGLASLLFGISRLDPITYLGVIALLASVSALASWAPAWRAARLDPLVALRVE